MSAELKPCPMCDGIAALDRDGSVFVGQNYGDRYPEGVRTQPHGFHVRCGLCGIQTCWWHYEAEAIAAWNRRAPGGAEDGCVWSEDFESTWHTTCGEAWQFTDGGPAENNCRFCHGCAKPIKIDRARGAREAAIAHHDREAARYRRIAGRRAA